MFKTIAKFITPTGQSRSWTTETDQIILMAKKKKARILGFTSARNGAGVGLLCDKVAERYMQFGQKTLLLDLAGDEDLLEEEDGLASGKKAVSGHKPGNETPCLKYMTPGEMDQLQFGSAESLEKTLARDFDDTTRIIVKLPAMFQQSPSITSPLQGAAVCDCLFVVCVPGQDTKPQIREMFANLKMVNIEVDGLVMAQSVKTAAKLPDGWFAKGGNNRANNNSR